jgi:sugar fermentation stimulation protein A
MSDSQANPLRHIVKPTYRWIERPQEARFLRRLNRFACQVEMGGRRIKVYLPNTGRLEELLLPGAKVLLEKRRTRGKTFHDLLLVQSRGYPHKRPIWVSVDSRQPPALLRWAVENQFLDTFGIPVEIRNEPKGGEGRFDLLIESHAGTHIIETKSVNLLDSNGIARFPDAPTARGTRHLETLIDARSSERKSWVVFIVMREDALAFSPFSERDPEFSATLSRAKDVGIEILVLKFKAGVEMIYQNTLDILLPAKPFPGFWS